MTVTFKAHHARVKYQSLSPVAHQSEGASVQFVAVTLLGTVLAFELHMPLMIYYLMVKISFSSYSGTLSPLVVKMI